MLAYALDAARSATDSDPLVVVSPATMPIRDAFDGEARFAVQDEPRGTADALRAALASLNDDVTEVLVIGGDTPFLRAETLTALLAERRDRGAPLALLTTRMTDDGKVQQTCIGTSYADDAVYYYHRPATDDIHGYGPVLLAGAEMIRLMKNDRFQISSNPSAPVMFTERK